MDELAGSDHGVGVDVVEEKSRDLVAALERVLAQAAAGESEPVPVNLEVWAAWHGVGRAGTA